MYKENSRKERDKTHFFIGIVWIVPRDLVRGRSPDIWIGKWTQNLVILKNLDFIQQFITTERQMRT